MISLLKIILISSLLISFGHSNLEAQEILKHPRVAELEDRLNKDASAYISSRFPSVPFMVTVRVDPLRRETASKQFNNENLPFFDNSEEEEIRDEWDNSQIPLASLINRVKRINCIHPSASDTSPINVTFRPKKTDCLAAHFEPGVSPAKDARGLSI